MSYYMSRLYTISSSALLQTSYPRQSIRLQREPFETEINEEVEKEYQHLEAERFGEEQDTEKNIADMATMMEELEAKLDASNDRLEAKIDASQSRLEAMFQQLIASRAPIYCSPPVSPRDNYPTVSVFLPILADEPRNKAKEAEVGSPKLNLQVGGRVAQSPLREGCAEKGKKEKETITIPSPGLDTVTTGAGPSSRVGPEHPEHIS